MKKTTSRTETNPFPGREAAPQRASRRLRILLVDDDPDIVATLRVILQTLGHDVEVAFNGEQALEVARRFYPKLLLSDVVMPGKDGVEAAIEIRKLFPDCAVLLLSGDPQVIDVLNKARAQWMNFELMAKPVEVSELIRRIERLCNVSMEPLTHVE